MELPKNTLWQYLEKEHLDPNNKLTDEQWQGFLDESLTGKSMIEYVYVFDYSGGDTDHSQLSKGRWRCFKSEYGSGKIQEVELNKKKLIKGREKKNGMKDKIVDTIKIRRKVA